MSISSTIEWIVLFVSGCGLCFCGITENSANDIHNICQPGLPQPIFIMSTQVLSQAATICELNQFVDCVCVCGCMWVCGCVGVTCLLVSSENSVI